MSNAWKRQDLGGDGLQAVNRRLAHELRRRPVAYALLALFPFGAHRWYLREPFGALAYCALGATAFMGWWPAALAALAFAIFDAWWIDRRIAEMNKAIRRRAWLGDRPPPPPGHGERFDRESGT